MDEFEARIQELEPLIDDGQVKAMLEAARRLDNGVSLDFSFVGEDEQSQPVNERWQVIFTGVAEHFLAFEEVFPRLSAHHPRLRSWQEEWGRLMFASAPDDAEELEHDLRGAHDAWEYGPFDNIYAPPDLAFSVGQLAHGPLSLLTQYAFVLEIHGMRPSLLPSGRRNPQLPAPTLMLRLDYSEGWFAENYVIAQSFRAGRLPETSVT